MENNAMNSNKNTYYAVVFSKDRASLDDVVTKYCADGLAAKNAGSISVKAVPLETAEQMAIVEMYDPTCGLLFEDWLHDTTPYFIDKTTSCIDTRTLWQRLIGGKQPTFCPWRMSKVARLLV